MSGRAFLVGCFLLVVVRMGLGAHAPAAVDAHIAVAALALALVAGAPRHAQVAALLVVGGALLSVPASWDPWISLLSLSAVIGPAAFFLLASSNGARTPLLWGLGAGGALNTAAAVWQRAVEWPDTLAHARELGLDPVTIAKLQEARPLGLSVSPDLCGGMCLAGAFAAFALALDVEDRNKRLALAGVAAVSGAGVVVVRSFGTALAFIIGAGVCALAFAWKRSAKQGALFAGLGAAGAAVVAGAAIAARGAGALFHSAGERIENWRAALEIAVAHPVLGVGLMRFPAAYLELRTPESNLTRYAHSTPLQVLAEGGILGAILVVTAFALGARALWRRRATLGLGEMILAGGAAAYAVRFAIDYDGHVAQSASIAGVMWGLVLATDPARPASSQERRVIGVLMALAAAITLVLFVREPLLDRDTPGDAGPLATYSSVFPFDVEPRLKIAAKALDELDVCDKPEGCPAATTRALAALDPVCARAHPPGAALVLRARVLIHDGKLNAALKDIDGALTVDPGNALAHQLGIGVERTLGDKAATQRRLDDAARWHVPVPN